MKTIFVALGLMAMAACNEASFRAPTISREKQPTSTPAQPAQPTPSTPSPTPTTTTTSTPSPGKPGIFDVIGGWISSIPDIEINAPNPNEVTFGSLTKVFHIGDGEMTNTSCKIGVGIYPRRGVDYYFEFEVLEDNSRVDVTLGRVCGIDYGDTNHVGLANGSTYLQRQTIPAGASSAALPSVTLNRGFYTVLVDSLQNPAKNNDRDDYIVGRVRIVSDKKIKAGRVGARD